MTATATRAPVDRSSGASVTQSTAPAAAIEQQPYKYQRNHRFVDMRRTWPAIAMPAAIAP